MRKRLGLCFLIVFCAVIAAVLVPWDRASTLKDKLLGKGEDYSSLKVYSLGGDMKVFVDGEETGTVREDDAFLEIVPITAGDHEVKLVREATHGGFYEDFVRVINFEKGFDTAVSWAIGPSVESSSGWILFAQQKASEKSGFTQINLSCKPSDCNITMDNEVEYTAPISRMELSLDKQHTFKAKSSGFQDLEFLVLPEEEEDRNMLEGYELFFEVNLYQIPIE